MSTVAIEGKHGFFLADRAELIIPSDKELAWAERYVFDNPAYGWVLGKFVEAERENANRAYWTVDGLSFGNPSIKHAPMNLLHQPRQIVGTFVGSELMLPLDEQAADGERPHIEALGALWKAYFPLQYEAVAKAHADGQLFFSMECVAESLTCSGDGGCGQDFAYAGPTSPTYCQHLNERSSRRVFNSPWFTGGALIIPPKVPAWGSAKISELSTFVDEHQEEAEAAFENARDMAPEGDTKLWESLMFRLLELGRDFPKDEREQLAKQGAALPDGSFPIKNAGDLRNAIKLAGHASDPARAKSHIRKRAKALGLEDLIPDTW